MKAPFAAIARLRGDQRGAALVEFAMIAPVFLACLLAIFDMSYNIYAASMIDGVIQKAARDSSLEDADLREAVIDQRVKKAVESVMPSARVRFDRQSYTEYADLKRAETFVDYNGSGRCDEGEPFEDVNGNGIWDTDRGTDGIGGARDAVLYTVMVSYDRIIPLNGMFGLPDQIAMVSRTVLRNQPYGKQTVTTSVENCPR